MKRIIKKIFVFNLFLAIAIAINGISGEIMTPQSQSENLYYNNSQITDYTYYRTVEVDSLGYLVFKEKYDKTLGEFQYAINSQYVYRVGYDSNKEVVKYFRGSRVYTPNYVSYDDRRVKEISIALDDSGSSTKVRKYEYNSTGRILKMVEFNKRIDTKRMEVVLTPNQSVEYEYNAGRVVKELYKSYIEQRQTSSKYSVITYRGNLMARKEYYDEDGDLEYYYVYGQVTKQYKPNGEVVRDIIVEKDGKFVTEYYPPMLIKYGNSWEMVASERYNKGVKIGFHKQDGVIYRLSRLFPKKNGFAKNDYTVAVNEENEKVIIENTFFTQYKSWKESSTLVQKAYAVLKHSDFSYAKKLYSKWLAKDGTDLLYALPFAVRNSISPSTDFVGAEYIILAQLRDCGKTTLAEIFTKKGEREWCDIVDENIIFVASLSSGNNLDYNKIKIKSKGYKDFEFDFEIDKDKRIIDLGEIFMAKD